MDDQQQDALLEELRKLRGEVRALKGIAKNIAILLVLCTAAVAIHVKWFFESLTGVVLGSGIVALIWFGKEVLTARKDERKRKAPATVVFTATHAPPKP